MKSISKTGLFFVFAALTLLTVFFIMNFTSNTDNNDVKDIEGFWEAVPENCRNIPLGIMKPVLEIRKINKDIFTLNSYWLLDNEYWEDWQIVEKDYDEDTRQLTLLDSDGDTFRGELDISTQQIIGKVYLGNSETDPLTFKRAEKSTIAALYPRVTDNNEKYTYKKPEQTGDGLRTSTPEENNMNPALITEAVNKIINSDFNRIKSLLIVKNGKLVCEEYFYGFDKQKTQKIYSDTKSIVSLLIGIAIEQNIIQSVDDKIFKYFPDYTSFNTTEKNNITIKDLLTMTSGLKWEDYTNEKHFSNRWLYHILSLPAEIEPGKQFVYNGGNSILLAGIIKNASGMNADKFAEKYLFGPLGISEYSWVNNGKGLPHAGQGLRIRPRDMAKIGILVLNGGKWNGEQLVSEEWIKESTEALYMVEESIQVSYSYHWWTGKREVQDQDVEYIFARGWGGQFIFIFPDMDMIVVTTGNNYPDRLHWESARLIWEYIIPALK